MPKHASFTALPRLGRQALPQPAPIAERLPALIGTQVDCAPIFRSFKVAVLGNGSVGGRIATHLARLQVQKLWLADPKAYSHTSSATHDCLPRLAGTGKSLHVGRLCRAIHPQTQVRVFAGRAQDLPLDALVDVDMAIMAPDNLAAEMAIGQRFMNLGKPLVHAAVHGESLTVQIRTYLNADGRGPCPACGYGASEWSQLAQQVQYSCDGQHTGGSARLRAEAPVTRSFSYLCSTASDLALNQTAKLVLNLGTPVGDTLLEYCGYTNAMSVSPLTRNSNCPCHHCRYVVVRSEVTWRNATLEQLARAAGCTGDAQGLAFTVDQSSWVARGVCRCAEPPRVERFINPLATARPRCRRCSQPILPQPLHTYPEVPSAILGAAVALPLRSLGAGHARWVRIRGAQRSALVLAGPSGKERT